MELGLGLVVPTTGARADVLVRAPAGAPLGLVGTTLLAQVLPAGTTGTLSVGGTALPPSARLGAPPLVEGALLAVDDAPDQGRPSGGWELRCVGGPDAGGRWVLPAGAVLIGRDGAATVRVDDPDLSRTHARLVIGEGPDAATVEDLSSTNGTAIDGVPVGPSPAPLPPGAILRAGESRFVLYGHPEPAAPVGAAGDGRLAWNRPPRMRPPRQVVRVLLPAPPSQRERSPFPLLAVVAPLVLGVVMWRVLGNATFLLFTLLSPVLVVGGVLSERRAGRRRTRRQRRRWLAQREVTERTLREAVAADEQRRRQANPDPAVTALTALGPLPRLWERRRDDEDLLDLRVGLADAPAAVEVELEAGIEAGMEAGIDRDGEADGELPDAARTARSVPLVVALRSVGVLGVAGPRLRAQALARWLVVQAAVWHSPRDLQMVVLAEPAAAAAWGWARWLPHLRPDVGQDCRVLFGLEPGQAAARVAELAALVESRRIRHFAAGAQTSTDDRPVLLVVDGARALRTVPGLATVLADGPAVGVHAVTVETDPRLLPEECGATAVLSAEIGTRLDVRVTGRPDPAGVTADAVSVGYAERVARALAPVRDDSSDRGAGRLPAKVRWTSVTGLSLTGGGQDATQVLAGWRGTGRSTLATLGRTSDGVFAVDLRRDGPHALVAGTTGSGKSELLQSLVASLAVGNRPDELTFVLVDYKGGAAFGPCAELPHVTGLVTDLDSQLVERALTSLGAELTRREAILATAGVSDVEEHRRLVGTPGGPGDVLPRLVLVVDEFAALAQELPEFVGGLIGIAQRGRSLGVHLALATQRPGGVVSADIRANTNLRVCLAVPLDADSRDVLDSPLAATIARSTPGRGYARTGHGELTAFQAGRIGGPRLTASEPTAGPTVEVLPAAELGDPQPGDRSEPGVGSTDLGLLVRACRAAAGQLGLPLPRSPWLPPLPPLLVRDDVAPPTDPLADRPGRVPPLVFGQLDVPGEQTMRPMAFDLDRSTHLLVVGAPRTGRSTVLCTLAGAVAANAGPDDVHLYALDPGGGLSPLSRLPHTGAVVPRDAPERTERVLGWLADEVTRRQQVLGAAGHADLAEQRACAAPVDRLPHLLLLLDRWEAFLASYGDVDAGRLVDLVYRLLREGPAAGLHLVLTADRNGLTGRVGALVADRLLLRLVDRGDYAAAGIAPRAVPEQLPPGRGVFVSATPLLAQVALLTADPAGPAQVEALGRLGCAAAASPNRRPRRFEPLPATVTLAELSAAPGPLTAVVLGVGGDEPAPVVVDLAEHPPGLLVAGPPGSGRSTVLQTLAQGLRRTGLPVVAVAPRRSPLRQLPGCLTGREETAELLERLGDGRRVLLIDDAELLLDSAVAPVLEQAVRPAGDAGTLVVAAGTTSELVTAYRGFVLDLRRSRCGLLLSPHHRSEGELFGLRLPLASAGEALPGRGLLVVRGRAQPLQVALPAATQRPDLSG